MFIQHKLLLLLIRLYTINIKKIISSNYNQFVISIIKISNAISYTSSIIAFNLTVSQRMVDKGLSSYLPAAMKQLIINFFCLK